MDDQNIIALYWARSETAISETAQKYGGYCFSIAKNILTNHEDAEESVNDTYLTAWNAMPPRRPSILATFLGKITRRLAIDRWRYRNACKRGGGEMTLALDELEDCASQDSLEKAMDRKELAVAFKQLSGIPAGNGTAGVPEPVLVLRPHFGHRRAFRLLRQQGHLHAPPHPR